MNKDFGWYSENMAKGAFTKYDGQWLVIKNKKILSVGKSLKGMVDHLKKKGVNTEGIFVACIPRRNVALVY